MRRPPTRPTREAVASRLATLVDAVAAETPAEKKPTAPLKFNPFTINGTAEEPVFLVECNSLLSGLSYLGQETWSQRLSVARGRGSFDGHSYFSMSRQKLLRLLELTNRVVTSRRGCSERHVEIVAIGTRVRMPPEIHIEIPAFPDYQIEDKANRGAGYAALAATMLGPCVKRKVVFVDAPIFVDRGPFQIYIARHSQMTQMATTRYSTVRNLFGFEGRGDWLNPATFNLFESITEDIKDVIFISDGSENVAELRRNSLFVLVEISDDFIGLRIFHRILTEVLRFIVTPEAFEAHKLEVERQFRAKQQERIVAYARNALRWAEQRNAEVRGVNRKADIEQQITDLKRRITELYVQLTEVETSSHDHIFARLSQEFDALLDKKIAMVDRAYFDSEGKLIVITQPIMALNRRSHNYHMLGPCRIEILFPGVDPNNMHRSSVRLTQHVPSGHQRTNLPHCSSEGSVCFGNIHDAINQLVCGFEIQALVSLAVTFLQKPNVYDPDGRRISNFPICPGPITDTGAVAASEAAE